MDNKLEIIYVGSYPKLVAFLKYLSLTLGFIDWGIFLWFNISVKINIEKAQNLLTDQVSISQAITQLDEQLILDSEFSNTNFKELNNELDQLLMQIQKDLELNENSSILDSHNQLEHSITMLQTALQTISFENTLTQKGMNQIQLDNLDSYFIKFSESGEYFQSSVDNSLGYWTGISKNGDYLTQIDTIALMFSLIAYLILRMKRFRPKVSQRVEEAVFAQKPKNDDESDKLKVEDTLFDDEDILAEAERLMPLTKIFKQDPNLKEG